MTLPHASGSATSKEAAESMEAQAPGIAHSIWQRAAERGAEGVIADEMIVEFEARGVSHPTVTARMRALKYSKLLVRAPDNAIRLTRKNRKAEVWIAAPTTDFYAAYREPPHRNRAAEEALLEAARVWVDEHGDEGEGDALEALLDAAWAAYGEGLRPKPASLADDDWDR